MRIPRNSLSIKALKAGFIVLLLLASPLFADEKPQFVARVIDGDTVLMDDGSRVRLVGIDAPEMGQPWSEEAMNWLRGMTDGIEVQLTRCDQRDKYERVLGVVIQGRQNLNLDLVERGLAVPMLIPPCGKLLLPEVLDRAAAAILDRRGIFSQPEYLIIDHGRARDHVGERRVIRGKVLTLHRGHKAYHFNFGSDWRTDFTAVIFPASQARFKELGLEIGGLVGMEVLVIGPVREYNGPEIIVKHPDQILPLTGYPSMKGSDSP